jgi:hypothetical protein
LSEEKLPLSEFYRVLDHVTIHKSSKWWSAVVLTEAYGKKSVFLYLWTYTEDKWKRTHKFEINSRTGWEKIKVAVENMLQKMESNVPTKQ